MKVRDLMTREVRTCGPADSTHHAARLMWEADVGVVPVVDGERGLVGMVTDRDVCMGAYTRGASLQRIPVNDCMSREPKTCRENAELEEALDIMAVNAVRRLPVVDGERRLAGVISLNDITRHVANLKTGKAKTALERTVNDTLASISEPRRARAAAASSAASLRPARARTRAT